MKLEEVRQWILFYFKVIFYYNAINLRRFPEALNRYQPVALGSQGQCNARFFVLFRKISEQLI